LKTLKNSARNFTAKFSEILGILLFLTTEKSKFTSLGPITVLRPRLPRRFAQVPGIPGLPGSGGVGGVGLRLGGLKPLGWHCPTRDAGAWALTKQFGLMYWSAPCRPEEGRVSWHPATRSGIAIGSEL